MVDVNFFGVLVPLAAGLVVCVVVVSLRGRRLTWLSVVAIAHLGSDLVFLAAWALGGTTVLPLMMRVLATSMIPEMALWWPFLAAGLASGSLLSLLIGTPWHYRAALRRA